MNDDWKVLVTIMLMISIAVSVLTFGALIVINHKLDQITSAAKVEEK